MKYTTKRSKVEEVVIDLEDGCILSVHERNINRLSIHALCNKVYSITEVSNDFSHYEVGLELTNGLSYQFETKDKQLIDDLNKIRVQQGWGKL